MEAGCTQSPPLGTLACRLLPSWLWASHPASRDSVFTSLHPQRGGDPNAKVVRSPTEILQFDNGLKALARLMKGRGRVAVSLQLVPDPMS